MRENEYEGIICPACAKLHFLNRRHPTLPGARIAFNTDAGRRLPTTLTHSSPAGLLAAHRYHWIITGGLSQPAPSRPPTLASGSSATVSRSIGRITRRACTIRFKKRPSVAGGACGRGATFSPGNIEPASDRVAAPPNVRTTRTRIHKTVLSRSHPPLGRARA